MTLPPAVIFLAGLVIIVVGAELLLRGAIRIATMLGVQPMLIGLTVVALGTSAPELAIGVMATLEGRGTLAVGNIAGTNIFNILFILGMSAAIRPLPLQLQTIRLDVPVMIASAVALFIMALDDVLGRMEGLLLLAAAVAYTLALIRIGRRENAQVKREFAEEYGPQAPKAGGGANRGEEAGPGGSGILPGAWNSALLIAGIGLTVFGADLMIAGAVDLALSFGVSDAIIGLTVVAIGTSAPELATTLVATIKDERDVAVGNLLGSSISNILIVLGTICVVAPAGVEVSPDVLRIDLPMAAAVAIVCWPIFRRGRRVSRGEGMAFVTVYLAYLATLIFLRA